MKEGVGSFKIQKVFLRAQCKALFGHHKRSGLDKIDYNVSINMINNRDTE